jgi:TRAP-type mannitol/chloroaromatic compound transport system substrate-binding protein
MSDRKLLGQNLNHEERILLAQLTTQPGWKILVKLMAEACRTATEDVIKLDPTSERYAERVVGLQTTARAMNKFSAEVLDSVKLHQRRALQDANAIENPARVEEQKTTRFTGFKMPTTPAVHQSPDGAEAESN